MPQGSDTPQTHLWFLGLLTKCTPNTVSTMCSHILKVLHSTQKWSPWKTFPNNMKSQVYEQREIFLLDTEQTSSRLAPEVLKLKATSMFGSFSWFHVSWFIWHSEKRASHLHQNSVLRKNKENMALGRRDWQNRSIGLGRNEDMMCGEGGIWEWKLWDRLLVLEGTTLLPSPLYLDHYVGQEALLQHNYVTTRAMSVLLKKESQALTYDFGGSCLRITTYSHCLTLACFGASWPCADCAGYITLCVGVPWGSHES